MRKINTKHGTRPLARLRLRKQQRVSKLAKKSRLRIRWHGVPELGASWEIVGREHLTMDIPLYLVHDDDTESDVAYLDNVEIEKYLTNGSLLCVDADNDCHRVTTTHRPLGVYAQWLSDIQ